MYQKINKKFWASITLFNLCIVALLGIMLRSKMLFPMEGIEFKNLLHAHSHFAFGGWVSLALLTLMTYEILPEQASNKPIYKWLLSGIQVNAVLMMVGFILQGYAFFSILFSTLFIFVTYIYSYCFIKDLLRSNQGKHVKTLSIASIACLVLSSIGPFTLAYITASGSGNVFLYRDSIYTYLHLQYNGFFALAIFSLFINKFQNTLNDAQNRKALAFAPIASVTVFPTLFISYLWHFPNIFVNTLAGIGCLCIVITLFRLMTFLHTIQGQINSVVSKFVKHVGMLSFIAFSLKSVLQMGTMIPKLGVLVFGDRTIIIGYLHLVLLGFVSLYILAHYLYSHILDASNKMTRIAVIVFISAVIANETILMIQGFGNILMLSNSMYTRLLWCVAIWLFSAAILVFSCRIKTAKRNTKVYNPNENQ